MTSTPRRCWTGSEPIAPLAISPKNAEHVIGAPWRWVRDHARAWGLPVLRVDGKSFVAAGPFFEALIRHVEQPTASEADEATELDRLRAELLERRRKAPP